MAQGPGCPAAPLGWAPTPPSYPPSSSSMQPGAQSSALPSPPACPGHSQEGANWGLRMNWKKLAGVARDKRQSHEACGVILGLTPSCRTFCAFSNLEGGTGGERASACLLCDCPFLSAGSQNWHQTKILGPPKKKKKNNRWELSWLFSG